MFNSVGNPFGNRRIESSTSSDANGGNQKKQEQKKSKQDLFESNETDELSIGKQSVMSEEEIIFMVNEYISKLKNENTDDETLIQKADKWLSKFDVHKFMKNNPNLTLSDFNMVMFIETESLKK